MVGDRQLRRLKAAERKRLILFLFIYIIPDSIPDSATGDVEEELRLALIAQKKKIPEAEGGGAGDATINLDIFSCKFKINKFNF